MSRSDITEKLEETYLTKQQLFDEWCVYSSTDDIKEFYLHVCQMYDISTDVE